jgi:hypothetical protein
MPRNYLEDCCQLGAEFCMGGCEDRTSVQEAEEFPLLEVVAREWLMKKQQARKRLNRFSDL